MAKKKKAAKKTAKRKATRRRKPTVHERRVLVNELMDGLIAGARSNAGRHNEGRSNA